MGEWPKLFAPNVNASLSCPFSYKQNKVQHILHVFLFSLNTQGLRKNGNFTTLMS